MKDHPEVPARALERYMWAFVLVAKNAPHFIESQLCHGNAIHRSEFVIFTDAGESCRRI